ncbi:MAG: SpoIIE family protein phosphatase, partial [Clostridia bacterium]|nr:SpoIIE family protein phosphatase [Clostridia bacterium]
EAMDAEGRMFGLERTLEALNNAPDATPRQSLEAVRRAVGGFVRSAEQFDDMTMLCLEYNGRADAE